MMYFNIKLFIILPAAVFKGKHNGKLGVLNRCVFGVSTVTTTKCLDGCGKRFCRADRGARVYPRAWTSRSGYNRMTSAHTLYNKQMSGPRLVYFANRKLYQGDKKTIVIPRKHVTLETARIT